MPVEIKPDQIHIHVLDLDQPASMVEEKRLLLSERELERANRFHFDYLKRRYIVGRGRLREILADYLGTDPKEIRFRYAEKGKPFLEHPIPPKQELLFNCSDSGDLSVMAFAWDCELGIDVEGMKTKTDMEGIARRYFAKDEVEMYLATPDNEKMEYFYNCWTGKEAFMKAKGEGLYLELDSFSVEARIDRPPHLLSVSWDPDEAKRWHFYRFKPLEGFVSTLAYTGEKAEIKLITESLPNPA